MKRLSILLFLAVLSLFAITSFSSCGGDDDNNVDSGEVNLMR